MIKGYRSMIHISTLKIDTEFNYNNHYIKITTFFYDLETCSLEFKSECSKEPSMAMWAFSSTRFSTEALPSIRKDIIDGDEVGSCWHDDLAFEEYEDDSLASSSENSKTMEPFQHCRMTLSFEQIIYIIYYIYEFIYVLSLYV